MTGDHNRIRQIIVDLFEVRDERAEVASIDDPKKDSIIFSARFACPVCGYSVNELEPRLFSFNNPMGACPSCDGLGIEEYFDPELIVSSPHLSCAGGAVRGWDRRNAHYHQMIQSLARHYDFDIDSPFESLAEDIQDIILYGSENEKIEFKYINEKGRTSSRKHAFEGIIPNMERRYDQTDSYAVRDELSKYLSEQPCESCNGDRLNIQARHVFVDDRNLPSLTAISIRETLEFFEQLKLKGHLAKVGEKVINEIRERLSFLVNVGLDYLSLERSADTLSGGEAQRIRLASQIGSGLVGVMYVLDEPSIGLHQRDNQRLLNTLTRLRDLGNTVIVVEHDEEAIRSADYVVDIGPGAGVHGGEIVAEGTPDQISKNRSSLTGQYLSGKQQIDVPATRTRFDPMNLLTIYGAAGNNLKSIDVEFPIGLFVAVTGVSGSGKSTLVNDTLYAAVARNLNNASITCAPHNEIEGMESFDKVVDIDQSPIGRTPRSNPATYTGLFTPIRELFAGTQESRSRGYTPGRFSFNVKGGRCEACQGDGVIRVEMHFLPDVYVPCEVCKGKRYNRETLEIQYKGKNIYEILQMTIEDDA